MSKKKYKKGVESIKKQIDIHKNIKLIKYKKLFFLKSLAKIILTN